MVKIRHLLNPLILFDGWIGFQGDSEFVTEDGHVRMGTWDFIDIINEDSDNCLTLDSEIDDDEVYNEKTWKIKNDKEQICVVKFHYPKK